jgi:hypothetical protein
VEGSRKKLNSHEADNQIHMRQTRVLNAADENQIT